MLLNACICNYLQSHTSYSDNTRINSEKLTYTTNNTNELSVPLLNQLKASNSVITFAIHQEDIFDCNTIQQSAGVIYIIIIIHIIINFMSNHGIIATSPNQLDQVLWHKSITFGNLHSVVSLSK